MLGPIFNREVLTLPRRRRHYLGRSLSLVVLWVLALTTWQAAFGWGRDATLGDLAYFGTLLFRILTFLELVLVLFFSALFAASAVSQEKDRRTFVLLLLTDLGSYEIVLGKLFGSLLEILGIIVCAMPILALTMLLGGVDGRQVILVGVILLSSAIAAGSLGTLLALWREKTFQTLALTVLAMVLFLLVVEGLPVLAPLLDSWKAGTASASGWDQSLADWQARLSPYRAWKSVVEAPTHESLDHSLAYQFAAVMFLAALAMNALGIWKLRTWNPSGEPIQQKEEPAEEQVDVTDAEELRDIHASPGKPRAIWANPVLWREVRTRAYGRRPLMIKAAFLLAFGLITFWVYESLPSGPTGDRLLPAWGLVPVVVLSLLLLNAQSVTSITSERDLKSLELLLVTDLTPREFIFGKLGGIFYNMKEILIPPILLVIGYAAWGLMGLETFTYTLVALLVMMAFTAVLGLHVSLRRNNTRVAIGYSLGTIFFLFVGTLISIYIIAVSGGFGGQWTSFIVFLAVGIGGLYVVLAGNHPSTALAIAAGACPPAIFYAILNILIGDVRSGNSSDPLIPFAVITLAFSFTITAMLVPLLSEFDVALGYSGPAEE